MRRGIKTRICMVTGITYLDDREAEHGSGNVTDPHTEDHSDEHIGYEDCAWSRTCSAKDERGHHLRYMKLR